MYSPQRFARHRNLLLCTGQEEGPRRALWHRHGSHDDARRGWWLVGQGESRLWRWRRVSIVGQEPPRRPISHNHSNNLNTNNTETNHAARRRARASGRCPSTRRRRRGGGRGRRASGWRTPRRRCVRCGLCICVCNYASHSHSLLASRSAWTDDRRRSGWPAPSGSPTLRCWRRRPSE